MAQFFRSSTVWAVDFRYDGHPRRWLKALPSDADAQRAMTELLRELYGERARLEAVRKATDEEERQYLRDEGPRNVLCPTGRRG